MELIARFVVPRHAVPVLEGGLSPMQTGLMLAAAACTIGSAPTGTGKSYVYRKAVAAGRRVLFVVPTVELANNLAASTIADLGRPLAEGGEGFTHPEKKVDVWTGEQTEKAMSEGATRAEVAAERRDALVKIDAWSEEGEIIFATMEAVSSILLRPSRGRQQDVGAAEMMKRFDHIVFDEFHLLGDRGFALAALCAGLAASGPWRDEHGVCRAKVTLLSATPVEVRPVLARLGVDVADGDVVVERVVDLPGDATGHRVLHGDVQVEFVEADGHLDVLEALDGYLADMPADWGTCCIFDSLARHARAEDALREFFLRHGPTEAFGTSSSIAKQRRDAQSVLSGKRFIAATSTIEVGVTLQGLHLLVTDSGHSPLSLMQRMGRVARMDMPGRVVVIANRADRERKPWLAKLVEFARQSGGRVPVSRLYGFMAAQARIDERFGLPGNGAALDALFTDEKPAFDAFDALSTRAVFNAGLFWNLVMRAQKAVGAEVMATALREVAPPAMRLVADWLRKAAAVRNASRSWTDAFLAEARNLRDFGITVEVRGIEGRSFRVSEQWLAEQTQVLDRFPIVYGPSDAAAVHVDAATWSEVLDMDHKARPAVYRRRVVLPSGRLAEVEGRRALIQFQEAAQRDAAKVPPLDRKACDAAVQLTRATGVLAYESSEFDGISGCNSAVL